MREINSLLVWHTEAGFKFDRASGDKEEISWYIKNRVFLNKHLDRQKYCREKVQTANCDTENE